MRELKRNIYPEIQSFKNNASAEGRYASFDYCYNYFLTSSRRQLLNNIEKSCFELGFYMASSGMLRGSSFLLNRSAKVFQRTIEYIVSLDDRVWQIDIDNYSDDNIEFIIENYNRIKEIIIPGKEADVTLITKIQLGVFGFIPAFDRYFKETFASIFRINGCGFSRVNRNSLNCLKNFYLSNRRQIDKISNETFTIDFLTGQETNINFTKAKVVDIYGVTWRAD
jgi:hypothetical protein